MSLNWDKNEMKYEIMNVEVEVNMLKAMMTKQKLKNNKNNWNATSVCGYKNNNK